MAGSANPGNGHDGDQAPKQRPDAVRGKRSVKSWLFRVIFDVRDDIAKDYLKEAVKFVLYSAVMFVAGGGIWFGAKGILLNNATTESDFSYLQPLINEAQRGNEYGVKWLPENTVKPFLVYCDRFVSGRAEAFEQLEQFSAQFPKCVSTKTEKVGNKTFIKLSLEEESEKGSCLASKSGEVVERLHFCGCNKDLKDRAKENRIFLSDRIDAEINCPK